MHVMLQAAAICDTVFVDVCVGAGHIMYAGAGAHKTVSSNPPTSCGSFCCKLPASSSPERSQCKIVDCFLPLVIKPPTNLLSGFELIFPWNAELFPGLSVPAAPGADAGCHGHARTKGMERCTGGLCLERWSVLCLRKKGGSRSYLFG